ncbi:MAG: 2-hydroxyhepta-2,4-diene-1,7-dioate isomerase [Actinophytocola sp.]|uniref:fumarylacetoacetate hydrolase family protein n=1 Tax=Actinophytocola sp. TaxID=1872138 RepID=UPI0013279557|nr:fumarylacetoacetate hydrolase family protein [Actinophytocola sp.]MPZ79239.1 2-hydroxyhepta-2,4-diene-1,7-dioate isomerase [Actinophytocola sp.]
MRLATIRTATGTRAVRVEETDAVELGHADLGELFRRPDWRAEAAEAQGRRHPVGELDYAVPVTSPDKVICVGLNYRNHILEMGRELPTHPTLFAKYTGALIGAYDDITLPAVSSAVDWEAELGVVVGRPLRHASPEEAAAGIAGYTVVNDVTARDYQYRGAQWLQGKTFEATTPVGPWVVTPDGAPEHALSCAVDGEVVQRASTGDLVFGPADLLAYVSEIITLLPGDIIATGTPGGVGHARTPARYLTDGAVLTTTVAGVGECRNVCRSAK